MGYSPWGHKESDMTEQPSTQTHTAQPFNHSSLFIKSVASAVACPFHKAVKRNRSPVVELYPSILQLAQFCGALGKFQSNLNEPALFTNTQELITFRVAKLGTQLFQAH